MISKKCLVFLSVFLTQNVSLATDFNQGLAAFNHADYQQAYKIWLEVAETKKSSVTESFDWHKASPEQKRDAEYGLGLLFWQGKGVKQDYQQAEAWLRRAADDDHQDAALKLGVLYLNGLAGKKDESEARKWFLKAANAGQIDAQHNLGILFLQGIGGEKDLKQANYWFTQAAKQGDAEAKKQLETLKSEAENNTSNQSAITPVVLVNAQENSQPTESLKPPENLKLAPLATDFPKNNNSEMTTIPANNAEIAQITNKQAEIATTSANAEQTTKSEFSTDNLTDDNTQNYAIQIAALSKKENMQKMIDHYSNLNWTVYEKNKNDKTFYILTQCCFADVQTAKAAVAQLPTDLKKVNPVIINKEKFIASK